MNKQFYVLTKKDLDCALAHIVVAIKSPCLLFKLVYHGPGVDVEKIDEAFKHVQVESGRDQFSMGAPFLTLNIKSLHEMGDLTFKYAMKMQDLYFDRRFAIFFYFVGETVTFPH